MKHRLNFGAILMRETARRLAWCCPGAKAARSPPTGETAIEGDQGGMSVGIDVPASAWHFVTSLSWPQGLAATSFDGTAWENLQLPKEQPGISQLDRRNRRGQTLPAQRLRCSTGPLRVHGHSCDQSAYTWADACGPWLRLASPRRWRKRCRPPDQRFRWQQPAPRHSPPPGNRKRGRCGGNGSAPGLRRPPQLEYL